MRLARSVGNCLLLKGRIPEPVTDEELIALRNRPRLLHGRPGGRAVSGSLAMTAGVAQDADALYVPAAGH